MNSKTKILGMTYISILFLIIFPSSGILLPSLDLKEANVTNAIVTNESGTSYNFAVTLYHDDDGEDRFSLRGRAALVGAARLRRRNLACR